MQNANAIAVSHGFDLGNQTSALVSAQHQHPKHRGVIERPAGCEILYMRDEQPTCQVRLLFNLAFTQK